MSQSHELPEATRAATPRSFGNTQAGRVQPQNLADILERVLDKGIVIAGDIQVNLLEIELLTIKIRLLVASVDKAEEMGIDWWRNDPMFSSQARSVAQENAELRRRIAELEDAGGERGALEGGGDEGDARQEEDQKDGRRARR
jgi:hypothetical protein